MGQGRGIAGSQPMRYSCAHGAQINFGDLTLFNLWLYLGIEAAGIIWTGLGQVAGLLADAWGRGGELQGFSQ
jgi:hypothetical protein